MSDNSLNESLHEGYPKRARWEGDHDTLGYEIRGDLTPTYPTTIHYVDKRGVEGSVLGEFEELMPHNSWLHLSASGDRFFIRPDGHLSIEPSESERGSLDLGVGHTVVAWEHPDE